MKMTLNRIVSGSFLTAGIGLLLLSVIKLSVVPLTAGSAFAALILSFLTACWETQLFSCKCGSVRTLLHAYLPLILQTVLLIGLDTAVYVLLRNKTGSLTAVWLAVHITVLLLTVLLVYVIGIARTVLFRNP